MGIQCNVLKLVKSLHHPTTADMTTFLANLTINVLTFWAGYVLVDSFDGTCQRLISTLLNISRQTGFPLGITIH